MIELIFILILMIVFLLIIACIFGLVGYQIYNDTIGYEDSRNEYISKKIEECSSKLGKYDQAYIYVALKDEKERNTINTFLEGLRSRNNDYVIKFVNDRGNEMIVIERKNRI